MHYPNELLTLIAFFKKFSGVGGKTAERFAFQILNWPKDQTREFVKALETLKEKITPCPTCGCLKSETSCVFCDLQKRDPTLLCLVSSPKDVYAIEETRAYRGLYHVIGPLLSPLDGRSVESLPLEPLKKRLTNLTLQEVIIALDSTLEGDATALYLKRALESWGYQASRLAFGLPIGSSLEYVDYGTLERALKGRHTF